MAAGDDDEPTLAFAAATARRCRGADLWTGAAVRLPAGLAGTALLPPGSAEALLCLQDGRCAFVRAACLRRLSGPARATPEAFAGVRAARDGLWKRGLEPWAAALVEALGTEAVRRACARAVDRERTTTYVVTKNRALAWAEYDARVERRRARPWLPPPPKPSCPRPTPEECAWLSVARRRQALDELEGAGGS